MDQRDPHTKSRRTPYARLAGQRCLLPLLAAFVGTGCGRLEESPSPLTHGVYVWQRTWTDSLRHSLLTAAPLLSEVRVLAAEMDHRGNVVRVAVDHPLLTRTARPVIPVIRIDGFLLDLGNRRVQDLVVAVEADWSRAGARVAALEIDFDCATARLGEYTRFLKDLRVALPTGTKISITALPDWMKSGELPGLLAATDGVVLQVHAVENPVHGLFNADRAFAWIERFASLSNRPFAVALPTYGSRVGWDSEGQLVSIESEARVNNRGAHTVELRADPEALAGVLQRLNRSRPSSLHGIVWFRLPTERDRRAWSLATWAAVVQGLPLTSLLQSELAPPDQSGSRSVLIRNVGRLDATLPTTLEIRGDCAIADGVHGYQVARDGALLRLQRAGSPVVLRAGERTVVGWVRCASSEVTVDVTS